MTNEQLCKTFGKRIREIRKFLEMTQKELAKYAKIGYYIQALFCMNSRMMLKDVKNTIIWRHSDYDRR